ncbi:type IV conjugative transfer system lipoprotein TraV [Geobacter sp. DSM 9736]|uniref:type IV conjugative transfer system lipoprotein TraV n=1 Tax=Geobacter sp. DSM 9736 TaxID=1277350 RepID=UPI000B501E72|nr:type IV conjugative transfer system lipoprotein TraV [Geobacter sp. DSM 9736]SNB45426.1 conjugal transfer pilus assembly protein TraV [Geobacter sp. DSM 9736]
MKKALFLIVIPALLSGCALFNPYESDFNCPDTFKGKCASVRQVYMEDAAGPQPAKPAPKTDCTTVYSGIEGEGPVTACTDAATADTGKTASEISSTAPAPGNAEETNFNQYRSALYDKFNGLLKEPRTPIVAPPKVMRVLLLPYTGQDNEFYMLRYVYFFVDKPRWILGDSVTAEGEDE